MKKNRLIKPLLIFVMLGLVFSCNSNQKSTVENKNEKNIEDGDINFPQEEATKVLNLSNEKKIYVRAKIWGISSNHEEIVFSETPITVPDKEKDYIFYTDEVLYKIDDKGSLIIYAPNSGKSIPAKSFKDVIIIFKGLKTSSQIKDYSENYKKYGLEKMSIHE